MKAHQSSVYCPWTPKLPDPVLELKFNRDERPGADNPPPEHIFRPMFPPPTMFPIELVIREPAFAKIGDVSTALQLPIVAEVGRIPGMEPPLGLHY